MNRIDRISAILIQLQSRRVVKASDIAERFNISLRTVYRDVKTLEEAGVPLVGEAGVGYSLADGYRLPPVMFTREEAIAFLTAEKLVEKFSDNSTESSYKSGMFKIRSVLRSAEKEILETIDDHIEVLRRQTTAPASADNSILQKLLKCIAEKTVAHITYKAFEAKTPGRRDIEPIGIFYSSGYWHTIAFCRLRNDYRDFRTDRIYSIDCSDETFKDEHPSFKQFLEKLTHQEDLETVVINVEYRVAKYLQEQKYYYGFVSETVMDDKIQMVFLTPCLQHFSRWYFMFANEAEVVMPSALNDLLKERIEAISRKINLVATF